MSALDIKTIRDRAEAATPGPWNDVRIGRVGNGSGASHEEQIVNADGVGVVIQTHDGSDQAMANTVFVCHARTDIPDLCDEVERLRAGVREAAAIATRILLAECEDTACTCDLAMAVRAVVRALPTIDRAGEP